MTDAAWVPAVAATTCAAAVAGLLVAERRQQRTLRALCKTAASLAFVALAVVLDAAATPYGRWILVALLLGALGDVLLLGQRTGAFLAGLGAFLLSHGAFGVAFWTAGVQPGAAAVAALLALPAGFAIHRWLWPHLGPAYRVPVVAYVVAILVMCALAVGHGAAHGGAAVPVGALLFALSDLAVARERFVRPGFVNRAWGLPTYYAAQLLLAASVAAG